MSFVDDEAPAARLHGACIARLQLLGVVHPNAQYQAIPSSHISTVSVQLADRSSDHEELHRRRRQFDSPHGRMEEFQPLTLSVPRRKRHECTLSTMGRAPPSCAVRTPYSRQRCAGQLAAQFPLLSRAVPAVAALLCAIFGPAQGYFFQIGGAPSLLHGPIWALEWYSPVSGRQCPQVVFLLSLPANGSPSPRGVAEGAAAPDEASHRALKGRSWRAWSGVSGHNCSSWISVEDQTWQRQGVALCGTQASPNARGLQRLRYPRPCCATEHHPHPERPSSAAPCPQSPTSLPGRSRTLRSGQRTADPERHALPAVINQQAAYHQLTPNPGRTFGHMDFRTRIPELHAVMGSSKRPIQLKFAHLAQQQKRATGCASAETAGPFVFPQGCWMEPGHAHSRRLDSALALDTRELTRSTISAVQDPSSLPLPSAPPPVASGQAARHHPRAVIRILRPPYVQGVLDEAHATQRRTQWQPVAQAHAQGAPPLARPRAVRREPLSVDFSAMSTRGATEQARHGIALLAMTHRFPPPVQEARQGDYVLEIFIPASS
ncbi:hypothetical protein BKA56DRAFT_617999 [Ilyonectria sp. MPI-CAGE-AT-0026]|nr:hypothetical protein BKA56DRAFT_617999 [Ilyonectria sp. MPI-CAGE-AT-0026]